MKGLMCLPLCAALLSAGGCGAGLVAAGSAVSGGSATNVAPVVSIDNLDRDTFTDHYSISISVDLANEGSQTADIELTWLTTSGLSPVGGFLTTMPPNGPGIPYPPGSHTFVWEVDADFPGMDPNAATPLLGSSKGQVKVMARESGVGESNMDLSNEVFVGGTDPEVSFIIDPTSGDHSGVGFLELRLADEEEDPVDVSVQYTVPLGFPLPATAVSGTINTNLTTLPLPAGAAHTFLWQTDADLPGQKMGGISVTVTATESNIGTFAGAVASSANVTVDNNDDPVAVITTFGVAGDNRGRIPVQFIVFDTEEHTAHAILQYSTDPDGSDPFPEVSGLEDDLIDLRDLLINPTRSGERHALQICTGVFEVGRGLFDADPLGIPDPGSVVETDWARDGFGHTTDAAGTPFLKGLILETGSAFAPFQWQVTAFDPGSSRAWIVPFTGTQVDPAGGEEWRLLADLPTDLATKAGTGVLHRFIWDSAADIPTVGDASQDIVLRITPVDFEVGASVTSDALDLSVQNPLFDDQIDQFEVGTGPGDVVGQLHAGETPSVWTADLGHPTGSQDGLYDLLWSEHEFSPNGPSIWVETQDEDDGLVSPGNVSSQSLVSTTLDTILSGFTNFHIIATGDVDGDGAVDLVGVDEGRNLIDVFLQRSGAEEFMFGTIIGGFSLADQTLSPWGLGVPEAILLEIIDPGDSLPSLVLHDSSSGDLRIYRPGGAPFLGSETVPGLSGNATAIVVGDFDGNGVLEIVVAFGDESVSVVPYPVEFPVSTHTFSAVATGFQITGLAVLPPTTGGMDPRDRLIAIHKNGVTVQVALLGLANTAGTWSLDNSRDPSVLDAGNATAEGPVLMDINDDGRTDLGLRVDTGLLGILNVGDGLGAFAPTSDAAAPVVESPFAAFVKPLGSELVWRLQTQSHLVSGRQQVVALLEPADAVSNLSVAILSLTEKGTLTGEVVAEHGGTPVGAMLAGPSFDAADISGDGVPDAVVVYGNGSGNLTMGTFHQSLFGGFESGFGVPDASVDLSTLGFDNVDSSTSAHHDMNADGVPNVIIALNQTLPSGNLIMSWAGQSGTALTTMTSIAQLPNKEVVSILPHDWNADGRPDVMTVSRDATGSNAILDLLLMPGPPRVRDLDLEAPFGPMTTTPWVDPNHPEISGAGLEFEDADPVTILSGAASLKISDDALAGGQVHIEQAAVVGFEPGREYEWVVQTLFDDATAIAAPQIAFTVTNTDEDLVWDAEIAADWVPAESVNLSQEGPITKSAAWIPVSVKFTPDASFVNDQEYLLEIDITFPGTEAVTTPVYLDKMRFVLPDRDGNQEPVWSESMPGLLSEARILDLDGDHFPDLVVMTGEAGGTLRVFLDTDGASVSRTQGPVAANSSQSTIPLTGPFAAGDLDGDGDLDLAGTQVGSPTTIEVLLWNGVEGKFDLPAVQTLVSLVQPDPVLGIHLIDMTGDGQLDLVIATPVRVLMHRRLESGADQVFASQPEPLVTIAGIVNGQAATFLDSQGDRHPDLMVLQSQQDGVLKVFTAE